MEIVILTALGVGLSTVIGSVIGFALKNFSHKFSDIVLAFSAGVMLAAAVLGLILASLQYGGNFPAKRKKSIKTTLEGIKCFYSF